MKVLMKSKSVNAKCLFARFHTHKLYVYLWVKKYYGVEGAGAGDAVNDVIDLP